LPCHRDEPRVAQPTSVESDLRARIADKDAQIARLLELQRCQADVIKRQVDELCEREAVIRRLQGAEPCPSPSVEYLAETFPAAPPFVFAPCDVRLSLVRQPRPVQLLSVGQTRYLQACGGGRVEVRVSGGSGLVRVDVIRDDMSELGTDLLASVINKSPSFTLSADQRPHVVFVGFTAMPNSENHFNNMHFRLRFRYAISSASESWHADLCAFVACR
jgi:hypothetical protein